MNADLQSGDATATNVQQNLSSLIDQGNAAAVHSQSLLNSTGQSANNPPAAPVGGGTASPNAVQSQLPVVPQSDAAKTVQAGLGKIQDDANWISQNKGTASKEDIAAHSQAAEKDWEKFTNDSAGLQQSSDPNDLAFSRQTYNSAIAAFGSTQSDLKEVLGGRLNADLQSGDPTAKSIQQNTSSLIDQGNAMMLHVQKFLNTSGASADRAAAAAAPGSPDATRAQAGVAAAASVYVTGPGLPPGAGPVAGGTASPNTVSQKSVENFKADFNGKTPEQGGTRTLANLAVS